MLTSSSRQDECRLTRTWGHQNCPPTAESQTVDVFLIADKLSCCCRLRRLFIGALVRRQQRSIDLFLFLNSKSQAELIAWRRSGSLEAVSTGLVAAGVSSRLAHHPLTISRVASAFSLCSLEIHEKTHIYWQVESPKSLRLSPCRYLQQMGDWSLAEAVSPGPRSPGAGTQLAFISSQHQRRPHLQLPTQAHHVFILDWSHSAGTLGQSGFH